jgi:hypothetical protein
MPSWDRGTLSARTKTVRATWLTLALLLVGLPAVADSRQTTDLALADLRVAEKAMTEAAAVRASLSSRYEAELRTIDRLKKQRGSWRRDRQLRDSLAASLETAKKLEGATIEVKRVTARQAQARQRSLAAVTAELQTPSDPVRMAMLSRERTRLGPPAPITKKIVIPDLEIDPLADPEELEQQAAAIRQSEAALAVQVASLDDRSEQLTKVAELRQQHLRAANLSDRDDGQIRRGAARDTKRETAADAAGGPSEVPGGSGNGDGQDPPSGISRQISEEAASLAESSLVLGDVIDAATLESLRKAQASSDPLIRAAAAKQARDAAAAKLATLRKLRSAIEARAQTLRTPSR